MLAGNIIDTHVHTDTSPDAMHSADMMAERAIEIGLSRFIITDHCEINRQTPTRDPEDVVIKSGADARRLSEKYKGKLEILAGTEMGQTQFNLQKAEDILKKNDLDFVIGTLHKAASAPEDFSALDFSGDEFDIDAMMAEYFDELFRMSKWAKFDTLAHITYPHRYIEGIFGKTIDMNKYWDILDETFKNLIHNGIALEINTSGLRQKIAQTLPNKEYILRYKSFGGELITVGSDAHNINDLAAGIADGYALAKECGFDYVTYYKQRKAVPIKI